MIVTVTIITDAGSHAYTGHVVCRGPKTMDMLLTEPFALAGRSVQFPLDAIVSEESHRNRVMSTEAAAR